MSVCIHIYIYIYIVNQSYTYYYCYYHYYYHCYDNNNNNNNNDKTYYYSETRNRTRPATIILPPICAVPICVLTILATACVKAIRKSCGPVSGKGKLVLASLRQSALQRGGRSRGGHSQMHYNGKCFLISYVLLFATTT